MRLLADKKAISDIFEKVRISYTVAEEITLLGYVFFHEENGNFFVCENIGASTPALIVELDESDLWKLDNFQNVFKYARKSAPLDIPDCYAYYKREFADCFTDVSKDEMVRYLSQKRQLDMCDIFLLVPGKLKKSIKNQGNSWDKIGNPHDEIGERFKECMSQCIKGEYDTKFDSDLERKCIGEVRIEISSDFNDGQSYTQTASLEIVRHKTGICILEFIVPNCYIGGNKLLNYFCGDVISYIYKGEKLSLKELMDKLFVRPYGKRRSMVFAHKDTSDREIINALANEEFPMAEIGGSLKEKLKNENIAQYGTAQVYVSSVSMVERCTNVKSTIEERMEYQVLEIFFVELLLFQEVAIDKIYKDLQREQELQSNGERTTEQAVEIFEQINFDMYQALKFSDYERFNFPTTRISAKNVADKFGIEYVMAKYDMNQQLLSDMIEANKRRKSEKENKIKNFFLFLLSAMTAIATGGEVLNGVFYSDNTAFGYILAFIIMAFMYLIYLAVMSVYRLARKSVLKRKSGR